MRNRIKNVQECDATEAKIDALLAAPKNKKPKLKVCFWAN